MEIRDGRENKRKGERWGEERKVLWRSEDGEEGEKIESRKGKILLNYNDPHSSPTITNKLIYSFVKHGPDQGDDVNFSTLVSDNSGRYKRLVLC